MENLRALQRLQFDARSRTAVSEVKMGKLRAQVPAPILAQYERLALRGKKGVAIAQNGVCSECHLRIPSGTMAGLAYTDEIHVCDNCGRYLYLPEDEPVGLSDSAPPPKPVKTPVKRSSRRTAAHVV